MNLSSDVFGAVSSSASQAGTTEPETTREASELRCVTQVRILILDDDPGICHLIREALASKDFQIDVVSDPQRMEAQLTIGKPVRADELKELATDPNKLKELLKARPLYHVIILDYVIPGLETEQLLRSIKEHQSEASIIVVTAYPSIDSALSCLRAGTDDYLTKPFQVAQLQAVVTRCLKVKGLMRMSEEALREALGAAIRERRKALHLTLAELAKRTDVSLGYLSQIELGKNSASIETLYRISLGLGIKLADLFQAVQGNW
jgi:DNA-binding response OmpR family regulator